VPARATLLLLLPALTSGCITTTVVNIGQKSSLEKQLMGETEPLNEDELLVASVRDLTSPEASATDALTQRALAARKRQLFNRDDIDELRAAGCLGEALKGMLAGRPCDTLKDADATKLRERMIEEENADRNAIIDWAVSVDPVLTRTDRPQVEELYHRLLLERAKPGELFQAPDGSWTRR
jgi:uncharacterized protein YdbL (DUF1318 family)